MTGSRRPKNNRRPTLIGTHVRQTPNAGGFDEQRFQKGGLKGALVVVVACHQKEQTVQLGAGNNFFTSLCFDD